MNVLENPFKILNISNQTDVNKIRELCSANRLLMDDEKYSEYETILTNPSTRLEAEISWFPGVPEDEMFQTDDVYIEEVEQLEKKDVISKITLSRIILTEDIDEEDLYDLIEILDGIFSHELRYYKKTIFECINEDRRISKLPLINDSKKLDEQLEKLQKQVINEILDIYNKFGEKDKKSIMNKIVKKNVGKITNLYQYGIVEKKVYEAYYIEFNKKIMSAEESVLEALEKFKPNDNTLIGIYKEIDKITQKIDIWYTYAKPMIMFTVQTNGEDAATGIVNNILYATIDKLQELRNFTSNDLNKTLDRITENSLDDTPFSRLRKPLINITKDIPSLENYFKKILKEEQQQKKEYEEAKKRYIENRINSYSSYRKNTSTTSGNGCAIVLLILFAIGIISSIFENSDNTNSAANTIHNSSQSSSYTSSYTSSSYSSNPEKQQLKREIDSLDIIIDQEEAEITRLDNEITSKEAEMNRMYDLHKSTGSTSYYNQYVTLYNEYTELFNQRKALYDTYSENIIKYNEKVNEYNQK